MGPPDEARARAEAALAELSGIEQGAEQRFRSAQRVLSFGEYLALFAQDPVRYGRDAARYVRDMFDHFGAEKVHKPWGERTRFGVFDAPSAGAGGAGDERGWVPREPEMVGQEEVQEAIYQSLGNFVQDGRANRLVLLHGPNGSAKSTAAACILRGLELYSGRDEGALYRFHWVFPSKKTVRGSIGFGGGPGLRGESAPLEEAPAAKRPESYAHLDDSQIDARLQVEVRDHPLFLLPIAERRRLVLRLYRAAGAAEPPPEWLMSGRLCHKNHEVFEALLTSYGGSLTETLRHVQVERYFISRRYRLGAVTLGPELSVDARERQVTADRSLSSLPTSLQATTLYEVHGEIVDAAGGVLEFSDLLKRPIDAFRYLQLTLESGEVSLSQQTLQTNCVMIGSANEVHLAAFREHPEFPSFRGRFELVKAPYLRSYEDEQRIYDRQIAPFVGRHVAPHATRTAALFAVLTRVRQPEARRYPEALAPLVSSLTALEKAELYATGRPPERLEPEQQKLIRANVSRIYEETSSSIDYEGRLGVSPREMRTVLLDAAQSAEHRCLSPLAVLHEIDELCRRTSEFDWLREKPLSGGFHDHALARQVCQRQLHERLEDDFRSASGLIDEERTSQLFDRYVTNVSVWVKGEKVRNAVTGVSEPPDERAMREVETLLGVKAKHDEHRRGLIASIAAWAIDHPGEKIEGAVVLGQWLAKLHDAVFSERRKAIALATRDLLSLVRSRHEPAAVVEPERGPSLRDEERRRAEEMLGRLLARGYCEHCAADAAAVLVRARFAELLH